MYLGFFNLRLNFSGILHFLYLLHDIYIIICKVPNLKPNYNCKHTTFCILYFGPDDGYPFIALKCSLLLDKYPLC